MFPSITGALCSGYCENVCACRHSGGDAVALRMIEDACVRFATNKKPDNFTIPPKTESIAVVGAGLAGLSAALCLAQTKYNVTVFEADSGWGGSLRHDARFDEFDADISQQFASESVDFRFNTRISALGELDGFDIVYIATGEQGEDFGLLTSWDPVLLSTQERRVFMGGALTKAETAEAIAQGKRFSKISETFLQTGRVIDFSDETAPPSCKLDYSDAEPTKRVKPGDGAVAGAAADGNGTVGGDVTAAADGSNNAEVTANAATNANTAAAANVDKYSEDEAKLEAMRCLMCDCEKCMISCEMLDTFRKKPKKIAIAVHSDTKVNPPYSTHTLTRQAYSCNMCGHCKEICPADIDIGALLHMSRRERISDADYPAAFHDYWLNEMDFSTGEAAFQYIPNGGAEYIFFPGCQLGAQNPGHALRSFKFLRDNYNAGILASCCGAPAYWAGDDNRQNENFERIRNVWEAAEQPVFVFACATCESMFAKFLPEIERSSIYELLIKHDAIGSGGYNQIFEKASVFDPCNARENPEMEEAVRLLAKRSGAELVELPAKNRCCGYGGHIKVANPELYKKVAGNRTVLGENPYIVYCSNCREVFVSQGKECVHILDIALNTDIGNPDRNNMNNKNADIHNTDNKNTDIKKTYNTNTIPRIDEKRKNAVRVKKELMKELTGEDFIPQQNEWDSLELIISDELADQIEQKLIPLSVLREAVWRAESTGDKFVSEQGDICRCSLEKKVLTYWTAYKKASGGAWEIIEAYAHRMRFSREDA